MKVFRREAEVIAVDAEHKKYWWFMSAVGDLMTYDSVVKIDSEKNTFNEAGINLNYLADRITFSGFNCCIGALQLQLQLRGLNGGGFVVRQTWLSYLLLFCFFATSLLLCQSWCS